MQHGEGKPISQPFKRIDLHPQKIGHTEVINCFKKFWKAMKSTAKSSKIHSVCFLPKKLDLDSSTF